MNLTRLNITLGILLGIVSLLAMVIHADHTRPNWEFLPEMKRSPASSSFEENPVLPNGRTLQQPVAGTISRGEMPLHYAATKEDAIRAGLELKNPYFAPAVAAKPGAEQSDESKESQGQLVQTLPLSTQRGAANYQVFCVSCHGPGGMGDGPVAKRGFPPPPPLPAGKSAEMKDGQLFHILTYGQGSMSSMAAQLSRDDRWDVINYIRSLQQSAAEAKQAQTANAASPETPVAEKEGQP